MTSGSKEEGHIQTGYEFSPQLAQGYVTDGCRTATDVQFFVVAVKVVCVYVVCLTPPGKLREETKHHVVL